MKATIQDKGALSAVSPTALSAYARVAGWIKVESFGEHSDVYSGNELPEIVLPRTPQLGDYAYVVSQLIGIFAQVAGTDELSLYRDLVTADRDVIRVRVDDANDGSVAISAGIALMEGASEMILAAACSLSDPRPLYRSGANRNAADYLRQVRLGQTEQGSYAVTLLTPVVPPPIQLELVPNLTLDSVPIERQVTNRLVEALTATRRATERTIGGDTSAFLDYVQYGVSANLCEALVKLAEPFPTLDVSVSWARTRPMKTVRDDFHFDNEFVPILREAARSFRSREPQPDVRLFGFVQRLKRDEREIDGTITLRSNIDGRTRSIEAVLDQFDYERAIRAHSDKALVVCEGDLERVAQRWKLLRPHITDVIALDDETDDQE